MKNIKYILSFVLVAVLISACGSKKDKDIKISFMHSMVEQERIAVIEDLIKEFEKANPGIKVESMPVEEDAYNTKITTLGSSNKLPSIIEVGHDYAKVMDKDQFVDTDLTQKIINNIGEDQYYDGALQLLKSEDGSYYTGVPFSGWVQGIWYSKSMFEAKNLAAPDTWENILAAAKAYNDPSNKKYGIGLANAKSIFAEQVFSQFALSNGANVLDKDGKASVNTPEMKEALNFYKELSGYTIPGSNDVTEVKDAFMNKSVPMILYSTYIMPSVYSDLDPSDLGFAVPKNKEEAAYGTVSSLVVTKGLSDEQKEATEKFMSYMTSTEVNTKWIVMSPGGMQPVLKSVVESDEYVNNEVVKSFSGISSDVAQAFDNLKVFGQVGEKNFAVMGDITSSVIIGQMVNDATVGKMDLDKVIKDAQTKVEKLSDK